MSDKPHGAHDGHGHGDDHGHGHGHGSRFIQHHYDDAQHQFDSGKLGIWLFLAQEVLFFSALFVAYVLYRHHHPEIYAYAHKYLDVKYGAINTAVLIFSSLTAAWAVRAAQLNQKKLLIGCLATTIVCAITFLGIKYIEYSHKYHEQILFGENFDPCVSSNGTPLLTKSNACSGHESSVVWDTGRARATSGCFPDYAIDQNPMKADVQASCKVAEVKVGPTTKVDGKDVESLTPLRPILEKCPDWVPAGHPQPAKKYPCWRVSAQPSVCEISYSFTWRDGGAFGFAGPFTTEGACAKDFKAKTAELKKRETDAVAAGQPIPTAAVLTPCVRGDAVGVIVEYGDHGHRPSDVRITAECLGPPPAIAIDDPFAPTAQTLTVGKKPEPYQRLSAHDEKDKLTSGPPPENTSMFFTIYFAMTGLHGIHVLAGVIVFVWLLIRAMKGHFTPDYFGPVDFAALYWHIVDLIWIFLFPLLYLIH